MTKKIFFVSSIGSDGSEERQTSDFVMRNIISPVANKSGYETLRSDIINTANTIDQDIISQLNDSDIVIADVTGTNPNVMFEIGYRTAVNKPLIVMAQSVNDLPFDIHNIRVFTYPTKLPDLNDLQSRLGNMISVFETGNSNNNSNSNKNIGQELGEKMVMDALATKDMSALKEFAEIAKIFGADKP